MKQIIKHFTDSDLYTFTVQYYILMKYPQAEVEYTFFDRNKQKYPQGFDKLLQEQINYMTSVKITDEEINFMKEKCYYLPDWYFNFLKGYTFNPNEVKIKQDKDGYLDITIKGKWWSTVMWEMPILSTISELFHIINKDVDKINSFDEYNRAYIKASKLLNNEVAFADMGTRRRFSFEHMDNVINAFTNASRVYNGKGRFNGTSNVYFAMKYNLTPIGTMSHQIISFEEVMSGVFECNFSVMQKWASVYNTLGIMLYDCFGDNIFFKNISANYARLFDGLRVDSGNNIDQLNKIINMYEKFKINPKTKQVIFSNGLNIDDAIQLHKDINGKVNDSYGIGTEFTCGFKEITYNNYYVKGIDIKSMNIVIKLTKMRYSKEREWHDCVKLSCDKGKTLGNIEKCNYLQNVLNM